MKIVDYAAIKWRRPYWLVGVAIAVLALVLAVWLAMSPYLFPDQLRAAARNGDRMKMEEMINFPRVREGLKSDLKSLVISEMDRSLAEEEIDDNPFAVGLAQLAKGLAGAMMDGMVDQAVSPASFEKFAKGESTEVKFNGQRSDPIARLFPARGNEERFNTKARYLSYSRFRYVVSNNKGDARFDIDLQRRGLLGWQVVRITPRISLESLRSTEGATRNAAAAAAAPEPVDTARAEETLDQTWLVGAWAPTAIPQVETPEVSCATDDAITFLADGTYTAYEEEGSFQVLDGEIKFRTTRRYFFGEPGSERDVSESPRSSPAERRGDLLIIKEQPYVRCPNYVE